MVSSIRATVRIPISGIRSRGFMGSPGSFGSGRLRIWKRMDASPH